MFQLSYNKLKFSVKPVYKFEEFKDEKLSFYIQQGQDIKISEFQKQFTSQPDISSFLKSNNIECNEKNSYYNPTEKDTETILSQIKEKANQMLILNKPLFVFVSYLGEENMLYESNGHYKQSIRGLLNEISEQFVNVYLLALIDIHPSQQQKEKIFNVYDFLLPETEVRGNINLLFQTFQKSTQETDLKLNNIINKFYLQAQHFEGFYLKDFIQEFYMENQEIQNLQKKGTQYKSLQLYDKFKINTMEILLFPDEDQLDKYLYLERGEATIEKINDIIEQLLQIAQLSVLDDLKLSDEELHSKSRSSSICHYSNMLSSNQHSQKQINIDDDNNNNNKNRIINRKLECLASKARGWIGICYLFGRGKIIKNEKYAVEIFQQEILHFNSAISHLGLGEALYYGVGGLKKNKKQAAKHFKKATENSSFSNFENDRRAYWRLGELFYWGEGVVKERSEAINYWWQTASDLNYVCANCYLGIDYYMGSHSIDDIDKKRGLYLIRKAVQQDYLPAKQFLLNNNISQEVLNQEADQYIMEFKNNLFSQQNLQSQLQKVVISEKEKQQIIKNSQLQIDEIINQVD